MMIKGLSKKKLIWLITVMIAVGIAFIFKGIITISANKLSDQRVAFKWSPDGGYSQMSMFFNQNAAVDTQTLSYMEYQIVDALAQESITTDPEKPNSRLIDSCYLAEGKINLEAQYGKAELTLYGAGGDFFDFHEFELLSGDYFLASDMNKDYCVLDETAAWKLFGSVDVDGQTVYMGDTPLHVKGVIKMPTGKEAVSAGAKTAVCFVPYDFMNAYVGGGTITSYEIVMPNPVPGYAAEKLTKCIGVAEENMVMVENTTRFSVMNLAKHFKSLSTNSMRTKAVSFSWWENIARAREDRLSILTIVFLLFAAYAILTFIVLVIILAVQNKDTVKDLFVSLYGKIQDEIYRRQIEGGRKK